MIGSAPSGSVDVAAYQYPMGMFPEFEYEYSSFTSYSKILPLPGATCPAAQDSKDLMLSELYGLFTLTPLMPGLIVQYMAIPIYSSATSTIPMRFDLSYLAWTRGGTLVYSDSAPISNDGNGRLPNLGN